MPLKDFTRQWLRIFKAKEKIDFRKIKYRKNELIRFVPKV